ncbi:unnamed protein product [Heligmosomoides polygyrus]|uniref:NADH dehydrogenase [ubiquinone] 1 beta subcomplex subunit 7 n=1 Tax=Heligmosomoides polygyrus TaxID=6339 RepID=A0A183GBE4_HELPZ|nr:unnamed protein product [Heligmosomoides polygyrus]
MSSVISSSWSMWSPWSFCSNNVMVRVRACSTVRGYKCAGHNKEFQSCDSSREPFSSASPSALTRTVNASPQAAPDVDVVDPYSEDRRLAMRQLYQDYEVEVPEEEKGRPQCFVAFLLLSRQPAQRVPQNLLPQPQFEWHMHCIRRYRAKLRSRFTVVK